MTAQFGLRQVFARAVFHGSFSPRSLFAGGYGGFWLDVSDRATLWADASGTVPATVGGIVRRIDDKSGNGNNFLAPSNAASAILKIDELGLYCLEFTTGAQYYQLAKAPLFGVQGAASFFAAVASPEQTYRNIYSEGKSSSSTPFAQLCSGNAVDIDHLAYAYVRGDGSTLSTVAGTPLAMDAVRRVLGWVDNAKTITPYVDNKVGTPASYSASGALTLNQAGIGALYRSTSGSGFFLGRMYGIIGVARVLDAGSIANVQSYLNGKISRNYNPAWANLTKWLAGGTSGKTVILSGDSTTSAASDLFVTLNRDNQAGECLAGVTFVNRGESGRDIEDFVAGVGTYPLASIAAENASLYVLCWGINNVRNGSTSQATLVADLTTAVNYLKTNCPGADIILWGPNELISSNESGNNWVSPTTSGQTYTDILYNGYASLVGTWANVPVLQKQTILSRTSQALIASDPYMLNELHPGSFGQKMTSGLLADAIRGPI